MCTKCLIKAAVIAAVSVVGASQTAKADSMAKDLGPKAKEIVMSFAKELKGTLVKTMKAEGPVSAIGVCNVSAPEIAEARAKATGWSVGRTSEKLRNSSNAPDAWEKSVLQIFAKRKAAGEDLKPMKYAAVVEKNGKKVFRFMKAIPVGKPCLTCHGENIKPEIKAKLKELYPNDAATGFKLGDLRGAFTLSKPLN